MLKPEVIKLAKKDLSLRIELMKSNYRSEVTIRRWFSNNDEHLATYSNLSIICRHLNMPVDELIVKK